METVCLLLGALLIATALLDMFREVVHPGKNGFLVRGISRTIWRLLHLLPERSGNPLSWAAPLTVVVSIGMWVILLILGWALIIWPQLPQGYVYAAGVPQRAGFIEALYISQMTLTTLGYGDIVPRAGHLRILLPLEAFLGFVLLSTATSWTMSIYPPVSRRHFLAHELHATRRVEETTDLRVIDLPPGEVADFLERMTSQVVTVRSDLVQFPLVYYFRTSDRKSSLAVNMPFLYNLARRFSDGSQAPEVTMHACRLRHAIDDLCETLAAFLSGCRGTENVLRAYAEDHRRLEATDPQQESAQ